MTEANYWIRTAKDTVTQARLDAEHFDPAYEALEASIRYTSGARRLGSLVSYCKRGQQPEYVPGGEVLVVNSQHVGEHFINVDGAERTSLAHWESKARSRARKFDILMNSTGIGTIGRVNCVLHDEKTVVDNHVAIIRVASGKIDPVYLAVFLNSKLGRLQTYKWQSGSSGQLEIYPDEILRFWVAVPDEDTQRAVRQRFEDAYNAYRRAAEDAGAAEDSVVNLVENS